MKKPLISILILSILSTGLSEIIAQEVILTSGKTSITNQTTKQVAFADNTPAINKKNKYILEFSVVSGLENAKNIELEQTKNLLENYITLSFNTNDEQLKGSFSCQVYDMDGKLWINKDVINKKTKILMTDLPSASYFIMIFKNDQAVKIFKVSKKMSI